MLNDFGMLHDFGMLFEVGMKALRCLDTENPPILEERDNLSIRHQEKIMCCLGKFKEFQNFFQK